MPLKLCFSDKLESLEYSLFFSSPCIPYFPMFPSTILLLSVQIQFTHSIPCSLVPCVLYVLHYSPALTSNATQLASSIPEIQSTEFIYPLNLLVKHDSMAVSYMPSSPLGSSYKPLTLCTFSTILHAYNNPITNEVPKMVPLLMHYNIIAVHIKSKRNVINKAKMW